MEITLDGMLIFKGEITRASGGVIGGCENFGDVSEKETYFVLIMQLLICLAHFNFGIFKTILFTTDEDILELVSHYDLEYEAELACEEGEEEAAERPRTADQGDEGEVMPRTSGFLPYEILLYSLWLIHF